MSELEDKPNHQVNFEVVEATQQTQQNQQVQEEEQQPIAPPPAKIAMKSAALNVEEVSTNNLQQQDKRDQKLFKNNGERLSGTLVPDIKTNTQNSQNISVEQRRIVGVEKSSNEGDCSVDQVICLKRSCLKILLGIFLSLITVGIFLIILYKNNNLYKYFFFTICTVEEATHFLTHNFDNEWLLQRKKTVKDLRGTEKIGFENRYMTYLYSYTSNQFRTLDIEIERLFNQEILAQKPLSKQEIQNRRNLFGECIIDFKYVGFMKFLFDFMTNPFFILWWMSIAVWIIQRIFVFAFVTVLITGICIVILYRYAKRSRQDIQKRSKKIVHVQRIHNDFTVEETNSNNLVPGDFIKLQPQANIPCDVILIEGEAFVNESNITGESDPVPKIKLENNQHKFSYYDHSNSVIYEGSQIINSSNIQNQLLTHSQSNAIGLVIRTGFSSKKGQVIRKSLHPRREIQEFLLSLVKFCTFWIILSLVCFVINAPFLLDDDDIPTDAAWLKLFEGIIDFGAAACIVFYSCSLIFGTNRLRNLQIQAVNYNVIANAGKIQMVCFDKTGTLTENKIDAKGYWSQTSQFVEAQHINQQIQNVQNPFQNDEQIQQLLATCHSVQTNSQDRNELLGDVLDIQAFGLSNYKFVVQEIIEGKSALFTVESKLKSENKLSVVKRFDFKSEHASMSVIVKEKESYQIFIKGSPEKIKRLCVNVPQEFDRINNEFSIQGYRVLALAYRKLDLFTEGKTLENITRQDTDKNLNFLGFLILENPLKKDSAEVTTRIRNSELPMKVVSGDNNLTVAHTAIQLGIMNEKQSIYHVDFNQDQKLLKVQIQRGNQLHDKILNSEKETKQYLQKVVSNPDTQISIKGKAIDFLREFRVRQIEQKNQFFDNNINEWAELYAQLILISRCMSRCNPMQKKHVMSELRQQGKKICMVGDGANDCLAIQEANVGVSFSTADASLSSDFCTENESIDCVEKILLDGRNIMNQNYEGAHIYLLVVYMRYLMHMFQVYYYQIPNGIQNIYPAYFVGYIPLLISSCLIHPVKELNKYVLQTSIVSQRSILTVCGKWGMVLLMFFIYHFDIKARSFYEEAEIEDEDKLNFEGQINSVLFLLSTLFIALNPFSLYIGQPVKTPLHKSYCYLIIALINVVLAVMIFFLKEDTIGGLKLQEMPDDYRAKIFLSGLGASIFMFIWERGIVHKFALYDNNKALPRVRGMPFEDKTV